jgi:hypothetical protein
MGGGAEGDCGAERGIGLNFGGNIRVRTEGTYIHR